MPVAHVVGTMISRNALFAFVLVFAAGPVAVAAQGGTTVNGYQVETDESRFNLNSGDFSMPHRVRFYRPGTDVSGDHAAGNSKRGTVTLGGGVVVHDSGNAPEAGVAGYGGSGPATLTCDQLDIDTKAKLYTAIGHVHFAQAGKTGTSDRAVLDRSSGVLHLEGDVHLSDGGSTLAARTIDYNLTTKEAEVHGSPAVITQPERGAPLAQPPQRKPASPAKKPPAQPRGTR
ncbi:MAG: hypothetical protein NVS3B7_18470 [Candidatus Elarobacter sp.]